MLLLLDIGSIERRFVANISAKDSQYAKKKKKKEKTLLKEDRKASL